MLKPRRVTFDWQPTPRHWVPGDAFTTHVINVLHLLLPAGETWFCHVFRQALPLIDDRRLREDIKGFIGQEVIHARAHSLVLDHLAAQGIETTGYTARLDWMFQRLLGDHGLGRRWLVSRLAIVAAIEHFTCVLGYWALSGSSALDQAGADPTMLDLLRWHGAEEVEHRAIAFDIYQQLGGGYLRRAAAMATVVPIILGLWILGTHFLIAHDPEAGPGDRPSVRRFIRVSRGTGRLPTPGYLASSVPRYLRPRHHPSREASTEVALAYLARSPAARNHAGG